VAATSLFRRQTRHRATLLRGLFARSAALLIVATLVLILAPISISVPIKTWQLEALLAGLAVLLIASLLLLRQALRPLETLARTMRSIDPLAPGQRVDAAAGPEEVETLAGAFNDMLDRLEDERRESARRTLAAQEDERRRIARELHDQIGQNLTAVLLELKRLRGRVEPAYAETLADAQELARESLDELRRISYELRPAVLDDLGLASALAALADAIARRAQIEVTDEVEAGVPSLPPDVELAVYRIAQEALTNAVRHAGCTRVRLRLSAEGGAVYLRIADDGRGLGELPRSGGGIRGMRERALMIGGRLVLGVADEGGVEVELRVPSAAA
jgi:two-component system sensor histidine kinase UhpB